MKVPSSQLETLMILQSYVSEIKSWMACNKLKFNDDKSEFLVMCAPWSRDEIRVETLTVGTSLVNPLPAKLFNLNFHPLEVVSRWRDPQLQVSENYSDLTKWRSTVFKYCWLMSQFLHPMVLNVLKKMKTRIYASPAVKGRLYPHGIWESLLIVH